MEQVSSGALTWMIHHHRPRGIRPPGFSSRCLGQSWKAQVGHFSQVPKITRKFNFWGAKFNVSSLVTWKSLMSQI